MESSLNEAHHEERKAESFLNARRFQDAIHCHQKTVELLDEAMKLTKVERALESIRLQRAHHVRRQAVVRHKQSLLEASRRALLHQRALKMATGKLVHAKRSTKYTPSKCTEQLQLAIYRNIDDNDSLLQFLRKETDDVDNHEQESSSTVHDDVDRVVGLRRASGRLTKAPKDDKTVIEELRVNNLELRRLVDVLVGDLDESRAEVARLGQLVQNMRLKLQEMDDEAAANRLPTLVTAYSSSNSPFVFSSSSSSSSSSVEIPETPNGSAAPGVTPSDLPPLAPLEMPPLIDFSRPTQLQQQRGSSEPDLFEMSPNTSSSP